MPPTGIASLHPVDVPHLVLLGGGRLEWQGEPWPGQASQKKRVALLALLAAARGHRLSRDSIMARLWPESDIDAARSSLNGAVHVIRKELGDEVLSSQGEELVLAPQGLQCDLWEFETAFAARDWHRCVAAHSGPFLEGVHIAGAAAFDQWRDGMTSAIAARFARACTELAAERERANDLNGMVEAWRRLVHADPSSGTATRGLAAALLKAGDGAGAIKAITYHEKLVAADLGASLDPELAALRETARRADARLTVTVVPDVPRPESGATAATTAAVPRRSYLLMVAVLVVAAVLVAVRVAIGTPAPVAATRPHLVVVPFVDRTTQGDLGPLAETITQDVIDQLSGNPAMTIASWYAVRPYRDGRVAPDSLLRSLEATWAIEGSVTANDSAVRVITRLVDAATGHVLGVDTVQRPHRSLAAMSDSIVDGVARVLRVRLGRDLRLREVHRGTSNELARALFMRARSDIEDALSLASSQSLRDIAAAIPKLEQQDTILAQAARQDAAWLQPKLERVRVLLHLARLGSATVTPARLEEHQALLDGILRDEGEIVEALELRGRLELAWVGRDASEAGRGDRATKWFRRAILLDSTSAGVWAGLARAQVVQGAYGEAMLSADRALRHDAWLDEAEAVHLEGFAAALGVGDRSVATRWCTRARAAFPRSIELQQCELLLLRHFPGMPEAAPRARASLAHLDSLESAERARLTGRPYSPIFRRAVAATVLVRAGDREFGRRTLEAARAATAGTPELRLDFRPDEAYLLLALGDTVGARATLDTVFTARPLVRSMLEHDPTFAPLRLVAPGRS